MEMQELLFDPQTSGGLLVAADEAAACLAAIQKRTLLPKLLARFCQRTTSSSTFIEKGQI